MLQITVKEATREKDSKGVLIGLSFTIVLSEDTDYYEWPYTLKANELADVDAVIKRETEKAIVEFNKFAHPTPNIKEEATDLKAYTITEDNGVVTISK